MEVEIENVGEDMEADRAVSPSVEEDLNSPEQQNCAPEGEGAMDRRPEGDPCEIYMFKLHDEFKSTNGQESCNRKHCFCDHNSVQENVRRFCEALSNLVSCRRALCTHTFSNILQGNVCDIYCTWMEWYDVNRKVLSSLSSKINSGVDQNEGRQELAESGGEGTGSEVLSPLEAELGYESPPDKDVKARKTTEAVRSPNSNDSDSEVNEEETEDGEPESGRKQFLSGAFYLQPSLFEEDEESEEEVTINESSEAEITGNQQESATGTGINDSDGPHSEVTREEREQTSTVPESSGETTSNPVQTGRTLNRRESNKDVPELEGDAGMCFPLLSVRLVRPRPLIFDAVVDPIIGTTTIPVPPETSSRDDPSGPTQSQNLASDERSNSSDSDDENIHERSLNSENTDSDSSTASQTVEVDLVDLIDDDPVPVALPDASLPISIPLQRIFSSEIISEKDTTPLEESAPVTKSKENEKREAKSDAAQWTRDVCESELVGLKESNALSINTHEALVNKIRGLISIEIEDGEIMENSPIVSPNLPQSSSHQSKDHEKEKVCKEGKNKKSDSKMESSSSGNSTKRQILDSEDEYDVDMSLGRKKMAVGNETENSKNYHSDEHMDVTQEEQSRCSNTRANSASSQPQNLVGYAASECSDVFLGHKSKSDVSKLTSRESLVNSSYDDTDTDSDDLPLNVRLAKMRRRKNKKQLQLSETKGEGTSSTEIQRTLTQIALQEGEKYILEKENAMSSNRKSSEREVVLDLPKGTEDGEDDDEIMVLEEIPNFKQSEKGKQDNFYVQSTESTSLPLPPIQSSTSNKWVDSFEEIPPPPQPPKITLQLAPPPPPPSSMFGCGLNVDENNTQLQVEVQQKEKERSDTEQRRDKQGALPSTSTASRKVHSPKKALPIPRPTLMPNLSSLQNSDSVRHSATSSICKDSEIGFTRERRSSETSEGIENSKKTGSPVRSRVQIFDPRMEAMKIQPKAIPKVTKSVLAESLSGGRGQPPSGNNQPIPSTSSNPNPSNIKSGEKQSSSNEKKKNECTEFKEGVSFTRRPVAPPPPRLTPAPVRPKSSYSVGVFDQGEIRMTQNPRHSDSSTTKPSYREKNPRRSDDYFRRENNSADGNSKKAYSAHLDSELLVEYTYVTPRRIEEPSSSRSNPSSVSSERTGEQERTMSTAEGGIRTSGSYQGESESSRNRNRWSSGDSNEHDRNESESRNRNNRGNSHQRMDSMQQQNNHGRGRGNSGWSSSRGGHRGGGLGRGGYHPQQQGSGDSTHFQNRKSRGQNARGGGQGGRGRGHGPGGRGHDGHSRSRPFFKNRGRSQSQHSQFGQGRRGDNRRGSNGRKQQRGYRTEQRRLSDVRGERDGVGRGRDESRQGRYAPPSNERNDRNFEPGNYNME